MRILVLEDDESTRAMITGVLERLDPAIEIEVAVNGDDALKRYVERGFHDLVITDNVHTGLLGIELIELIREENPAQPIILETGNAGAHIEAFKHKHKDIPLLDKPYPLQQLQDTVRAVLRQRNGD